MVNVVDSSCEPAAQAGAAGAYFPDQPEPSDRRHSGRAELPSAEEESVLWLRRQSAFPDRVERYGDDPRQFIEWYGTPADAGDEGKTVCFIHGGQFPGQRIDAVGATA